MAASWRRDPAVRATEVEQRLVLLDPRTQRVFDLNRAGALIWTSVEEGIETVVERMVDTFSIDHQTARRDADDLIGQLSEAGLLVRDDDGIPPIHSR